MNYEVNGVQAYRQAKDNAKGESWQRYEKSIFKQWSYKDS